MEPLSRGADRAGQLAAAERKVSAQDQLEDTLRRIAENVAIAHQARATSESRIAHLRQHVVASEGTLYAYEAQFELNRRTLLDVLNARNELFNARSSLVFGTYDDLINAYFVEASVGNWPAFRRNEPGRCALNPMGTQPLVRQTVATADRAGPRASGLEVRRGRA